MAYTKQTWETGDIITADKLNNIETGIEDSNNIIIASLVNAESGTENQRRLTLTFKQIQEALEANKIIALKFIQGGEEGTTKVFFINQFSASDDYGYYISFEGLEWNFLSSDNINNYPLEDMG